jgi:HSP20 family molecular chaperone IbpA
VDLPGLKPEEIKLSVDNDALSISGERLPRHPEGRRLRVERPSGAFVRRLPLPQDACGEIHATFCNGMVELRVPRTHPHNEARPAQAVALEPSVTRSSTAACGSSGCEAKPALRATIAETQS